MTPGKTSENSSIKFDSRTKKQQVSQFKKDENLSESDYDSKGDLSHASSAKNDFNFIKSKVMKS